MPYDPDDMSTDDVQVTSVTSAASWIVWHSGRSIDLNSFEQDQIGSTFTVTVRITKDDGLYSDYTFEVYAIDLGIDLSDLYIPQSINSESISDDPKESD